MNIDEMELINPVVLTGDKVEFIKKLNAHKIYLGGSLGLKMQGISLMRPAHDVDLITNVQYCKKDLQNIIGEINMQVTIHRPSCDQGIATFMYNGAVYDVLYTSGKLSLVNINGLYVHKANEILYEKMKYAYNGVYKHYKDIQDILYYKFS